MDIKKRIKLGAVTLLLMLPALLVANNNPDHIYFNFIGLVYIWQLPRIAKLIMPQWMIDYFRKD